MSLTFISHVANEGEVNVNVRYRSEMRPIRFGILRKYSEQKGTFLVQGMWITYRIHAVGDKQRLLPRGIMPLRHPQSLPYS